MNDFDFPLYLLIKKISVFSYDTYLVQIIKTFSPIYIFMIVKEAGVQIKRCL